MKRLLFFALTALVLVSCATTTLFDADGRQLSKSEEDRITASVVSQRLAQRKYRIFADYMYPQRAPGVRLNDDWGVEVGRDSIGFFLPYFGQVYMADPAKGPGMIFIAPLDSYEETQVKEGHVRIKATCRYRLDSYQVYLDVLSNGRAEISVIPANRDAIRYTGGMDMQGVFFTSPVAAAQWKARR